MNQNELQKIRDKQMVLRATFGAHIRAKNKLGDVYYSKSNGAIIKKTALGERVLIKDTPNKLHAKS